MLCLNCLISKNLCFHCPFFSPNKLIVLPAGLFVPWSHSGYSPALRWHSSFMSVSSCFLFSFVCHTFELFYGSSGIMSLLPPSFGGGSGFVSCVGTRHVTHYTPEQSVHSVINTQLQNMKVFKLLVKVFFLATVITTATRTKELIFVYEKKSSTLELG